MNKKELTTIATQEQKLFLRLNYAKKSAKHFYNVAVKYRKEGNIKQAKLFWSYCKNAYMDVEKAWSAWGAVYRMNMLLQIPIEKYLQAFDEKQLADEKFIYENSFDDVKKDVPFSFVWAVQKTIKGGK